MFKSSASTIACAFLIISFCFALPPEAQAYSDLGAASYLIQILLGGVLGISMGIKLFFKEIKAGIASVLGKKKPAAELTLNSSDTND